MRPRVTFTQFRSPDDPMLLAWLRFRSLLIASPTGTPSSGASVTVEKRDSGLWRLLATNNRELGRSFMLYGRFDTARAHIAQLQAHPAALAIDHFPGPTNGSRGWAVIADGVPVMTCSRWYGSLSTGAAAAEGALQAFLHAAMAEAPDQTDASGRLRRGVRERADVGA